MSIFYVTYGGNFVYPQRLKDVKIELDDIAHHLTNIKRFGGALAFDRSYSVAEHSIHLAEYAIGRGEVGVARMALLHDASEAYLGDVVSGLKALLPDYQKLEKEMETLIYEKYRINTIYKDIVKGIDMRILLDEVAGLIPKRKKIFSDIYPSLVPLGIKITGKNKPETIKSRFLELCKELDIGD